VRIRMGEIAGPYNEEIDSALLDPPIAVWREHEASRWHCACPKTAWPTA
jgi:hypothetical protein